VLRAPLSSALHAVLIGVATLAAPASAQTAAPSGALQHMPLPGGLEGALASINDRVPADRSQFLLEVIRRTHNRPATVKSAARDTLLQSLLLQLDRANQSLSDADETVPLPLSPSVWIETVFAGRESPRSLANAILRSRGPALLYYGLFSLDEATRGWLATEPQLVADLAAQHAASFVVAAPGLRVRGTALRVPGGDAAAPAWEALVGRRAAEPASFVRGLVTQEEGRLGFFFATVAQLTPEQQRLALHLDSADPADRMAALRRLHAVFGRITAGWRVDDRVFWRPTLDPALLLTELGTDASGRLPLPGARRFWKMVFDEGQASSKTNGEAAPAFGDGDPADFLWLCEQIFAGERNEDRRRYMQVLFAARHGVPISAARAADAVEVIRGIQTHPALIATLERAKLADIRVFAGAVRRAHSIDGIKDDGRVKRALAQFQGALALVTRAAIRGGLQPDALAAVVSSLSKVEPTVRGDYEGQLVRWLAGWTEAHTRKGVRNAELDVPTPGPLERDVLQVLAGPVPAEPRFVEWEGTRYRIDFARAEAMRLARVLGEDNLPFLSSARALVDLADTLKGSGLNGDRLRKDAAAFAAIGRSVAWDRPTAWKGTDVPRRQRDVGEALDRAAQSGDTRAVPALAPALLVLADDLLARGLMESAYAMALGQRNRATISADEAARRHEFGFYVVGGGRSVAWSYPAAGAGAPRGWHVTGSVLGLDVRLAEFSLLRLSSRPPLRRPTLDDDQRRVLIETVALVEPASITDRDRDAIVAALKQGRARLASLRTPEDVEAVADEIRLSALRRALLAWTVALADDRDRRDAFLSPTELLWLGLGRTPLAPGLHAWGGPGEPRVGCQCLRLIDRQPLDVLNGRWHSGIFASAFPDLNLRLAELLAELQMPAALMAPVLASAMLDLVDTATLRDSDDRRGLVEFVHALRPERVELYLALLTTDGPLVPVDLGGSW
jgi:hypothetical protein